MLHSLIRIIQILFGFHKAEKVIFLDFDGVMATEEYTDTLVAKRKDTRDKFGTLFNPNNIEMLELIIRQTHAAIVITSDWRNYLSLWDMIRMWEYRKLPGKIIGLTPSISTHRGDEIDKWLYKHSKIKKYVIIDDMDYRQFRKEQRPYLVTTNHFFGLDKSSSNSAVNILNRTSH